MHTDEYEISLARELEVCRRNVRRLGKRLSVLEQRFGMTSELLEAKFCREEAGSSNEAFSSWLADYRSFLSWQDRMKQYEEQYRHLKI